MIIIISYCNLVVFIHCHTPGIIQHSGRRTFLSKRQNRLISSARVPLLKRLLFHVFNVMILKILNRKHTVVFSRSDNVMSSNAIVAPEGATLKAIETLVAVFFAVSTLSCGFTFWNGLDDVRQTVHLKVGRQLLRITAPRNLKLPATFWACNPAMNAATRLLTLI